MPKFKPPGRCPICDDFVQRNAVACHTCGSCERSGWNLDNDSYEDIDLTREGLDYDEFVAREFGIGSTKRQASNGWWWVAVILIGALLFSTFILPLLSQR
jgi:hypothetical protein